MIYFPRIRANYFKILQSKHSLSNSGHRLRRRTPDREQQPHQAVRQTTGAQTDQKWISRKDVSVEANLSSVSSADSPDESSVVVGSPYPKGFHPKTGLLLDESLLPNYEEISERNPKYGLRGQTVSKTPEPIVEEYGTSGTSSSSSSTTESNSEGDYSCENVREIYREKVSEYKTSGNRPTQKSYFHSRTEEKKFFDSNNSTKKGRAQALETRFQHYDREPQRPELRRTPETDRPTAQVDARAVGTDRRTADKTSRQEVSFRAMSPPKPVPTMRSIETQTNGLAVNIVKQSADKPAVKQQQLPKDLKTESKITVEVTKANKKERSQVISQTLMDETTGKMSRTTQVTTSKHVPVPPLPPPPPALHPSTSMREITGGRQTPSHRMPSPQRPLSPMRKAQSEINVTPVSGVSTRPASADDLSIGPHTMQSGPKIPSTLSFGSSYPSRSSLKSPSPTFKHYNSDEISVPRVGRVSIQDPLHMVVLAPPESFDTRTMTVNGMIRSEDKSRWRETSSSTICNEMTTDAFKDEDGKSLEGVKRGSNLYGDP